MNAAEAASTLAATTCEIRPLATVAELIEAYRMRYDVYRELGFLQRFNKSGLDIDEFDSSSIPFGAFDPVTSKLIGTIRLVTTSPQPDYDYLVRYVVASCDDEDLARQAWGPQPHPLPSIISDDCAGQVGAFNCDGLDVFELSRFIVRSDRRGSGISRGMTELGMAYAMRNGPVIIVGGCVTEHLPMYARYGFYQLPNSALGHFHSVGQMAHTIICRSNALPEPTRTHIGELLTAMSSGDSEHTHDLARDSRGMFRLGAPRRLRRRTMEW